MTTIKNVIYEVRIRGRLGRTILQAFPRLESRPEGPDTVLSGFVTDQAALYGVLSQVEALGLELLEVRRIEPRSKEEMLT